MPLRLNGTTGVSAIDGSAGTPVIQGADANTGFYFPGADQVAISTNGSERFKIDSSGNITVDTNTFYVDAANNRVGVGTTSNYDDSVLEVRKANGGDGVAIRVTNDTTTNGSLAGVIFTNSTSDFTSAAIAHKRNDNALIFFNGQTAGGGGFANATEAMRLDSSNRLLVGTSTARSNFYNDTNSAFIQLESASNDGSALALIQNFNANTLGGQLILAKSNSASVGSNTLVASGDACGRVSFQGNDGTQFVEAAQIRCDIDGTPGANDMPGRLVFSTTSDGGSSPTERLRIAQNGDITSVRIYNQTGPVSANVGVDSNGLLFRATSSAKYKTNIETIEDSYSQAILNCRPVWYQAKETPITFEPGWGYWGFIAEEVAQIDPRLVQWKTYETTYDENGSVVQTPCDPEPDGVLYDRFVPHLLNLIKRQQQAIEDLQAEVEAIKAS